MNLRERWLGLCSRLGSGDGEMLFAMVDDFYAHPPRAHHSLDHIAECLSTFDQVRQAAIRTDELEFALWLHDCIYVPTRADNEERSAAAATIVLGELRAPPEAAPRVTELILATKHRNESLSGDVALIADIDMQILAADPARYTAYAAAIRHEYSFASDADYRRGRSAFLRGLLARPAIYRTASFAGSEAPARRNMTAELERLASPSAKAP